MTKSPSPKLRKKRPKATSNKRSLLLTLSTAVLLISCGGLVYFFSQGKGRGGSPPFGSSLLPIDTVLSLTLTTEDKEWRKLQTFNIPETRKVILGQLDAIDTVLKPHNLNYKADIKPWIGDFITLATLTPEAAAQENLSETSKAWIFEIRNQGQAQRFFNENLQSADTSVPVQVPVQVPSQSPLSSATLQSYQGVELRTLKPDSNNALTIAIVNQSFVMTTDIPTMREVIETAQGTTSLATQKRFQEAMAEISVHNSFAKLYLNIPANTLQISEQEGRQLNQATLERLEEYEGFGSTISFSEEGLTLKNIAWLSPTAKVGLTVSQASKDIAKVLPEDTVMMMAGENFQEMWQEYQQGRETQVILPLSPKDFQAQVLKSTGINFEKTFLPWMTGDYVTAIVPQSQDKLKRSGVVFMVQVSDKTAAEKAVQELEAELRQRHALHMSETRVNDLPVVIWRIPPNFEVASRGWLDNKVLFFSVFAPVTDRITHSDGASLLKSPRFENATRSDISPKSGQFFFDIPKTVALMESSTFLPKLAPAYQKYAREFEVIGGTSATPNDWSTRYDLQVNFKKK